MLRKPKAVNTAFSQPPTNLYSAEWGFGPVPVYQRGQTHLVQVVSTQWSANALLPKRTGALQVVFHSHSPDSSSLLVFGHGGNVNRGSAVKTDHTEIICDWFCKAYLDHWRGYVSLLTLFFLVCKPLATYENFVDLMIELYVEYPTCQNERPCEGLFWENKSDKWKNSLGHNWGVLRESIHPEVSKILLNLCDWSATAPRRWNRLHSLKGIFLGGEKKK